MKKANKKPHLMYEERVKLEGLLKTALSYRDIAEALTRGVSTISEEVTRNGGRQGYTAEKAHLRAYFKQYRKKRGCNKVALDRFLTRFVERKLVLFWSPERIALRLKVLRKEFSELPYASAKSIRKYLHKRPGLEQYLHDNRVPKKSGPKQRNKHMRLENRVSIDERPPITTYGHFEGDFIVSPIGTTVLLVLVEMVSKTTLLRLLPNRKNDAVNEAIADMLHPYTVKSLTVDNDIAFQKHEALASRLNAPIYFTRPYTSTDKPLVEHTNKQIREFIPKKTDLRSVTVEEIQRIQTWLNHTPRQVLNGYTADEVGRAEELSVAVGSLLERPAIDYQCVRIRG